MEAIKNKWFWCIFISILSIFAMSHNANAIAPTFNIDNYALINNVSTVANDCTFTGGTNQSQAGLGYCAINVQNATRLDRIETAATYNLKKDDLINFYLFVYSDTTSFEYQPYIYNFNNSSDNGFDIIDFKEVSKETYVQNLGSFNGYINSQPPNYDLNLDFYEFSGFYKIYEITLRNVWGDRNAAYGLHSRYGIFILNASDVGQRIRFSIRNIKHYRYSGSEENKEVEEKTQEAVDDSEAAGGSSSQDAQTGTTGLLNAITGAVSVISSASPTNCKINGNMGNLDMGQLDLCANPAPAFIQTIGSLILILMCVPLAISLFNRFIAIFRSFQS